MNILLTVPVLDPECYAAWDPSVIPQNSDLKVGMQFAIGDATGNVNDTFCQDDRTAPRLTFESHMAPLDIKFDTSGNTAWVTFHGSWCVDLTIRLFFGLCSDTK